MIESVIYLSPIVSLLLGIAVLAVCSWQKISSSWVFRWTKIFVAASFGFSIIFYNRSAFPDYMHTDKFSAVFGGLMYVFAGLTLFLSRKWYAGMNLSGTLFCAVLMMALVAGEILLVSRNFLVTAGGIVLMLLSNYLMFLRADKKKNVEASSRLYAGVALFMFALLVTLVCLLFLENTDLSYDALSLYFEENADNLTAFVLAAAMVLIFVFLLGLPPLHFWYTETTGQVVLPVFSYFTLVTASVYAAAFIRLNAQVFSAISPKLELFYQGLAILALFAGALGACSGKNIRKIFAYGTVYQLGIILLLMQRLTPSAVNLAFVYLVIFLISMSGVCACLFSLKNKGEYLFMLNDFSGMAFKRPFVAAALTFFLFSLSGFPPFLGFWSFFAAAADLVQHNNFYQLALWLAALLILTYAYLQIIKTLYFENSQITFDKADRGVYFIIVLILGTMMVLTSQPYFLLQNFQEMLESVLIWQ